MHLKAAGYVILSLYRNAILVTRRGKFYKLAPPPPPPSRSSQWTAETTHIPHLQLQGQLDKRTKYGAGAPCLARDGRVEYRAYGFLCTEA